MPTLIGDLWPSDLVKPIPSSPIAIMKEQALRLGSKTGDLVLGDVRPEIEGGWVSLAFDLVMPLLENYRFTIFEVSYPADQVHPTVQLRVTGESKTEIVEMDSFVEALRSVLNSERVRNVISNFVDMQYPQPPVPTVAG
jgi:hypothetical protein